MTRNLAGRGDLAARALAPKFAGERGVVMAKQRTSWMLARLDDETRDHHAAAEADRFRVLDDPTPSGYRWFLATVFRFEYAVEAKLVYVEELPLRLLGETLRTGMLGDDMLAVGIDERAREILARPLDLPRFRDGLHALGWLYALQRNTLHHGALYRALAPRMRGSL